jgi:isopentenyl phosphate kinase
VKSAEEWQGFSEVWRQATALNHLVMEALSQARLPAIAFPPSAMVLARNRQVEQWNLEPLRAALDKGLLPVVYGDVTFDTQLGGTILSTEDLFSHLAPQLKPSQLLFAGLEPGVWADFPLCQHLLDEITPASFAQARGGVKGSSATDVTGGMLDKVHQVIDLVGELPGLQGMIFSGEQPGYLKQALLGEKLGTAIHESYINA